VTEEPRLLADRFELGEVLGRGGMADVFRAHDRVLHRDVAVKLLRETAADPSDRQRFTSEARTLAGLSHRGLVMLLDVGTADERPFLVMELVDGPTLAELVSRGPVDAATVARTGQQVAEALAYAHAAGVVHRDVKPANVLLGRDGRARLADFGIARLLGDTVRHTRTGTTIGTAAYLSPEQVQGQEVTGAADVYALGLALLEALTGERAFAGTPTEAALARLHRDPDVPVDLPHRELLVAMTSRDAGARPPAREVAERLAGSGARSAGAGQATATAVMAAPAATPPPVPLTDRVGDAMAARARTLLLRARSLSPEARGLLGAGAALVLLLVVLALASGGDAPSVGGPPADAPTELQSPLAELHDAVAGR
jgi:serine/threonine protein kinase